MLEVKSQSVTRDELEVSGLRSSNAVEGDMDGYLEYDDIGYLYDVIDDAVVSGYEQLDQATRQPNVYAGLDAEQSTDIRNSTEPVEMEEFDADAVSRQFFCVR